MSKPGEPVVNKNRPVEKSEAIRKIKMLSCGDKKLAVFELYVRGYTISGVCKKLGYTYNTVKKYLKDVFDEIFLPEAEDAKRVEIERLHRYLRVMDEKIEAGDTKAINTALKISYRTAQLLGLDAPSAVDVTSAGEQIKVLSLDAKKLEESLIAKEEDEATGTENPPDTQTP